MFEQFGEFFVKTWNVICNIWAPISIIAPIIGDICLFFIAVYTFYLTVYPRRLKFVNYTLKRHLYEGNSFEIALENRSLTAIGVETIYLNLDENNRIKIFDSQEDEMLTIESFHTEIIKMKPFTGITNTKGESLKINIHETRFLSLTIYTTRGIQHLKYKFRDGNKSRKKIKEAPALVYRKEFDGKVIGELVKYVIVYFDENDHQNTIYITKFGAMSEPIFGFNKVDKKMMNDETALKEFFNERFEKEGLRHIFEKVDLV